LLMISQILFFFFGSKVENDVSRLFLIIFD
jgi:hypothetical protein